MRLNAIETSSRKTLTIVSIVALGGFFVYSLVQNLFDFSGLDGRVIDLNEQVEELRLENQAYLDQAQRVESSDFAEVEIRDKLGLVQPGETVVLLPQEYLDKSQPRALVVTSSEPVKEPNWYKWFKLVF